MISLIIPCHNESENLSALYARVAAVMERIAESWEMACRLQADLQDLPELLPAASQPQDLRRAAKRTILHKMCFAGAYQPQEGAPMATMTGNYGVFDPRAYDDLLGAYRLFESAKTLRKKISIVFTLHKILTKAETDLKIAQEKAQSEFSSKKLIDPNGTMLDFGLKAFDDLLALSDQLRAIPVYGHYAAWRIEEQLATVVWNAIVDTMRHDLALKASAKEFQDLEPYLPRRMNGSDGMLRTMGDLIASPFMTRTHG
ncbi:hypothetical protein [Acidithiobacillus sulfuriphilus]|uniref:hypothetical protein n=1 Tax=Acidithiobacillus sulfuriphilus TaxID=1867749 RepID=UPI003F622CB5